jgi:hypothetical protein
MIRSQPREDGIRDHLIETTSCRLVRVEQRLQFRAQVGVGPGLGVQEIHARPFRHIHRDVEQALDVSPPVLAIGFAWIGPGHVS